MKGLAKPWLARTVSVDTGAFSGMPRKSHQSREGGRLGVFLAGGVVPLFRTLQPEGAAHFTVCIPLISYSPPPLPSSFPTWEFICCFFLLLLFPRAAPGTKLFVVNTARQYELARSLGQTRASEEKGPVRRPPPVALPLPGVSRRLHCARDAAFPHQVQQVAVVSKARPFLPRLSATASPV